MAIIKDRAFILEDGTIPEELILKCIEEHRNILIPRFKKLEDYYNGKHEIINRTFTDINLPNNKLIHNNAEYITDMITSYLLGNPIQYNGDGLERLIEVYKKQHIHNMDTELAREISKYGIGYELVYMSSDLEPLPKSTYLDVKECFLVVDNTVENRPMYAVHYYPKFDIDNKLLGYYINVYTDTTIYNYFANDGLQSLELIEEQEHFFNAVPIIEYWNKPNMKGDYEGVISLIDAYNKLQSDRLNDKEQLVDAILALYGASLGDSLEEATETAKLLKELKMLELPLDGKAEWLTKQLKEADVEILRKAIKEDIHQFSKVPCLTDESFASNASGVAMKYKLLGMEQLAKTKESYMIIGLRERLNIYANILLTKGIKINTDDIEILFTRSLPQNEQELANMVTALDGQVSRETRLSLLPFVKDVEKEIERLEEEKASNIEMNQKAFGSYDFKQIPEDGETEGAEGVKGAVKDEKQ